MLRSGVRVPIQDQPFQVLRLLLEAEGKVVTREQLRAALWPEDTFVDFEHGVNTAVKKVRQALEDSVDRPKFIETLPKYGYRFIMPVVWETNSADNNAPPAFAEPAPVPHPNPPKRYRTLKSAVAVIALTVIAAAAFLFREDSRLSLTHLGVWIRHLVVARSPEPRIGISQRRLTANPTDTPLTGGVISPDGKYLAYTDTSGFYVRHVDSGETFPVPLPKGFAPLPECWLPDSVHLIVSWFDDPNPGPPSLWKISFLGGTPRKLVNEGSSARISPDASKIAFLAGPWDNEQIWLVGADGANATKIIDGGRESFGAVAWAPDAKRFAYVRATSQTGAERPGKQIEIYDLLSGHREVVFSDPGLGDAIAWTNTGRLIYSLNELEPNQGDSNLWSIQLRPGSRPAYAAPTRITNDRAYVSAISLAADGKRMSVLRSSYQGDVYLADVSAQGRRLSKPRRLTLDERNDWPSSWTIDNKAVLFISDRDGLPHLFRQRIDETQPELLVGGNNIVSAPRLTPDGLSAIYSVSAKRGEPTENAKLMRVPIAGGPAQFVLEAPGIRIYQCATLPSTLCIHDQIEPNSEYVRFFAFDPAGGNRKELLAGKKKRGEGPVNNWGLSPDGKYLATMQSASPYDERVLRIFNLTDGTEKQVPLPKIGLTMGMDWAADSKSIWVGGFMGRGAWGTRSGILTVALDGKVGVALEGFTPEVLWAIPSPDGRRLALLGNTQTSNAWLLENF